MNKVICDFKVAENIKLTAMYNKLILACDDGHPCRQVLSEIVPGQFVEVRIDNSKTTFLRRPVSVNYVDAANGRLHLLVRIAGDGTRALCDCCEGDLLNVVLPLGNGFSVDMAGARPLLIGGGVGVAPLLYLGKVLNSIGIRPTFLLAAKTAGDLLDVEHFREFGEVVLSTDDGSAGHHGLVTQNPALDESWDMIYCCGPEPMMRAVARIAREREIRCEVSLENTMACGLGACLCCVEDTVDGNVCVCKDGPVFNIDKLKWFN